MSDEELEARIVELETERFRDAATIAALKSTLNAVRDLADRNIETFGDGSVDALLTRCAAMAAPDWRAP